MTARTWGGRTSLDRVADRRGRLLDAGLQCFGTEGYAATTVDDVCARAGLTKRYFYELAANREALLRLVHDEVVADGVARAAAPEDPVEGLRAFLAWLAEDPRRARIQFVEVVGVSAQMEAHRRETTRAIALVLAERLEAGGGRSRRLTAHAVVGAVNELVVDWAAGSPDAIEDLEAELVALLELVLRPARNEMKKRHQTRGSSSSAERVTASDPVRIVKRTP